MFKKMIAKAFANLSVFHAAMPSRKRKDPGVRIQTADSLLTEKQRNRLSNSTGDLQKNYAVVAWAIRKHLDYVSRFSFSAKTGDPVIDDQLELLVANYSKKANCDKAGRHSLRKIIRLAEARRVLDGDVVLIKFDDGKIQAIESDRIRNPADKGKPDADGEFAYSHGVKTDPTGMLLSMSIHRRLSNGSYVFERDVVAENLIHFGYFDAFDQIRGVSPLTAAIMDFQDCFEVKDYARAKAKVSQMFAMAFTRDSSENDYSDDEIEQSAYKVDMSGPVKLDLDPGDNVEFLESKHPSTEFQAFIQLSLQAAIKSLDLPWSFYDESYTNFFGSKAALIQYQQSCKDKQADVQEVLNDLILWQMNRWIATGELRLPAGVIPNETLFDWIPAGMPWWDPSKEVRGDLMAVNAGLRTRTEIRKERYGDSWKDVIDKLEEEEAYMIEHNVMPIESRPAGWIIDGDNAKDDEDRKQKQKVQNNGS